MPPQLHVCIYVHTPAHVHVHVPLLAILLHVVVFHLNVWRVQAVSVWCWFHFEVGQIKACAIQLETSLVGLCILKSH